MLQSNYKGVDKTLSTSNKIAEEFYKELKEEDDLDRFLEIYNKKIAGKYKLKKAKTAKTAIRYILLYLSYDLLSNLRESLRYEDIVNDDLFTKEYKKSITKAVNYSTGNKDVKISNGVKQKKGYSKEIITGGIALAVVKRMRNRTNVILDSNGVKLSNEKLIEKVITETTSSTSTPEYTRFRFNAVIDGRTTPICRSLNGRIFDIEEAQAGVNIPPLHPRCRSSIEFLP